MTDGKPWLKGVGNMICKKCGYHSEGMYGICPACGQLVKQNKKKISPNLLALIISLSGVFVISVTVFVILFVHNTRVEIKEQIVGKEKAYAHVTEPILSAEPLPQEPEEQTYNSAKTRETKLQKYYKTDTEKEPETQQVSEVATEPEQTKEETPVVSYKSEVVFSNSIGEVNGKTYSIRCVGSHVDGCNCDVDGCYGALDTDCTETIIPALPKELKSDSDIFTSFCEYDGYVYYVAGEPGTGVVNRSIYRCKTDFTEVELLAEWIFDVNNTSYEKEVYQTFIIKDDILYINSSGYSMDLATKEFAFREYPDFSEYDATVGNGSLYVCGDKVFFASYDSDQLWFCKGNNNYVVADMEDTFFAIDGYANDYIYFSVSADGGYGKLYRVNIENGESEYLHKRLMGGGFGPYFCF